MTVMHPMETEDINPAEDKKEKKDQNTQPVDQQLHNVKQKEKVKPGVRQNDNTKRFNKRDDVARRAGSIRCLEGNTENY